jgi:hypothetical protein
MTDITSGAQAFIFILDTKRKNYTLRFLCIPGEESTPAKINSIAIFGRLKPLGGGVWQKVLSLEGGEDDILERLGTVMELLGFGIHV